MVSLIVIVWTCRPSQLTMLQGVANRDIKLENILLDASEPRPLIKISDFGYSKVVPAWKHLDSDTINRSSAHSSGLDPLCRLKLSP